MSIYPTNMYPEIPASKLAGFVGLHKYQDQDEVFYDMLLKDKDLKSKIYQIHDAHGRRGFYHVLSEVMKDQALLDCVSTGIESTKKTADVPAVLDEVESRAKLVLDLRRDSFTPELRQRIAAEVRGRVSKQRGIANESAILNNYETQQNVKVVERNTRMIKKDYTTFSIVGRIDGYVASENRIVDSKERTRFWPTVPVYDEIQLRCYMDMLGAAESELLERFPDGTTRTTKFLNDPEKWNAICEAVQRNVTKLNAIIENADELKRVVFANTVCINQNGTQTDVASPK